jgi:Uma2 family endonuclease
MGNAARKPATYDDVLNAPPNKVAEIIEGELILSPRPAGPHSQAETILIGELEPPFNRGRGGPGGWIILLEPELHFGSNVLVPDLAGWRRETMSVIHKSPAYFTIRPDWVCEVLSPSTERIDRGAKVRLYAAAGVSQAWLINPLQHTLEVLRLSSETPGQWTSLAVFKDEDRVRADPFAAIELELAALWQNVEP